MHAHLDHDNCMEVTILRGRTDKVQHFAEHVIAERGVRHGRVMLVPTEALASERPHTGHAARKHRHRTKHA
jgi:CopG family transcriptional regulator, nickel-responsive regulator